MVQSSSSKVMIQDSLRRNELCGLQLHQREQNRKKMILEEHETIVRQIVDESNHEPKEAGKSRVLMGWRSKLEKEPPHLRLHQIDEIVREVRRRLETAP